MASSIENLNFHIVWATKYRYKLLTKDIAEELKRYLLKKEELLGFKIQSLAIEQDHVHMLVCVRSTQVNMNELIRKITGGSSFLLRKRFKHLLSFPSLWTPSHFCATVGNVSKDAIEEYLAKQGIEEKEYISRTFMYKVLTPSKSKVRMLRYYFNSCLNSKRGRVPSVLYQDFLRLKRKENEFGLYLRAQGLALEEKDTKDARYWLRISGSKYLAPMWLGLQGRCLPKGYRLKDSSIREKGGNFYVYLSIEEERVIKAAKPEKVIAIDLGVRHPITSVTLDNGHMKRNVFYGKGLKNEAYKRTKRYAQLQSSGIKEPKERTAKHTERIKHLVHAYTTALVKEAEETGSCIVVGNLRGIRKHWVKGKVNKGMRKRANAVPYGRIMSQLWYKGTLKGIPVVFVNEAYTSRTCSRCGNVDKDARKGDWYSCKACGYINQADVNGALNIGTKALANLLSQGHLTSKDESSKTSLMALAIGR